MPAPDKTHRVLLIIGTACGVLAAFGWAAGFVAAKHGVQIGFTPADIAFHRFFWTGLLLLPTAYRAGWRDLGGVGWGRGVIVMLLSGPPQAMVAYTGFILVPLGHGTTIQPACAALSGLILAVVFLGESVSPRRVLGAAAIVAGLVIYGAESLTTSGPNGVIGDLLFVAAGVGWATFGTLLRKWNLSGMAAVGAVAVYSIFFAAPAYFFFLGIDNLMRHGWLENLLQALVQGILAGALPIYLFAHSVMALGAGRAATFPALVPVFGVLIGFVALGVVPTWLQLIGLVVVLVGFQFTLRR
jgi:drug/metabolite transporter (DMT)-like permease